MDPRRAESVRFISTVYRHGLPYIRTDAKPHPREAPASVVMYDALARRRPAAPVCVP
jgi:hypothetical protein